jgi:hypothetical protein
MIGAKPWRGAQRLGGSRARDDRAGPSHPFQPVPGRRPTQSTRAPSRQRLRRRRSPLPRPLRTTSRPRSRITGAASTCSRRAPTSPRHGSGVRPRL